MRLRFSRRSLRQLEDIVAHVAEEDEGAAAAILQRVETLAVLISRHPTIGRPTDLANVRVFRASPYPYLLFYHCADDRRDGEITVLRIRHTARRENWREGR